MPIQSPGRGQKVTGAVLKGRPGAVAAARDHRPTR